MDNLRSVLPLVLGRWGMGFVGVILLALTLWNYGPLWPPLSSPLARVVVILFLLFLWAGPNVWLSYHRRQRDKALTDGVVAGAADSRTGAAAEEVAAQRDKLARALALLRRASRSRGYLYEQPWYVIIGPPGAGKTTALLNSGMRFPLADELGQGAVAGTGGTRLCDWWFADSAVLIDTAGRYTTQDSDATVDRAGWEGFLDLLRRTRPREPLNGVIVAFSLSDLAVAPREERIAHARAVRRRIKEIEARLRLRVPVYALLTKADRLAGFTEFFDDLDSETRGQVWGTTFAVNDSPASKNRLRQFWHSLFVGRKADTNPPSSVAPLVAFAGEFKLIVERLNSRLLTRLQAERSPERRALLAGFPAQFASLQQPVQEFVDEAFSGSRLNPAPFLRGIYFSSGTQEGTPIDRLTGVLARSFGIDQRRAPSLRPVQGRSYFLSRLLREVVFGEAMLVSRDPTALRRRWLLRGTSYAAVILVVLVVGGEMLRVCAANQSAVDRTARTLDAYDRAAAAVPLDPVTDGDLQRVAPLLDQARSLGQAVRIEAGGRGILGGIGLSQRGKLAAATASVYRNALHNILLPRLIWRLEAQMRGNIDRPDFLFEATQVYLMLGGAGPLDPDLIRSWMQFDWQETYPGPARQPLREDLQRHLDALLAEPLPQMQLDGALVAAARTTFSRVPLAQRVYARIKALATTQAGQTGQTTPDVPPWRPSQALGPAGEHLFARASGKPLSEGIPGFYTRQGFYQLLLPALGSASRDVADESWVLGKTETIAPDSPQLIALENQVIEAYEIDYEHQWEAMLDDLNIVGFHDLTQASQDLFILGSPASPLRSLLDSVAQQLTLSAPPSSASPRAGSAGSATAPLSKHAQSTEAQIRNVLGPAPDATAASQPSQAVDEHFSVLRAVVAGGTSAPIQTVLALLNQEQQQLGQMAAATPGGEPPAPATSDPTQLLQAEASTQPQPLRRWLAAIAGDARALRAGGARQEIVAAYDASSGPRQLCRQAVDGHYPFNPDATEDTPLEDFARLFAPGGLLDGFFNTRLRPYVDTTRRPWRARSVDGVWPPISTAGLAQFERAAAIRDAFFGAGGTSPQADFIITPESLDDASRQVTLTLGGTSVSYAHGPASATQITWPGAGGINQASLTFTPGAGGGALQTSGPWAMLRLFDQGSLRRRGSSNQYVMSFDEGNQHAAFAIETASVTSPFSPGLLRGFACPSLR